VHPTTFYLPATFQHAEADVAEADVADADLAAEFHHQGDNVKK
jgi:hypothetical protein